jgi:ubiquinone/menaquinone biosynthesis C-methylase UbiE
MRNDDWLDNNSYYWNKLASRYNSFYNDKWSILENKFITEKLNFLKDNKFVKVLDLGCGTGLGYELCTAVNPNVQYTGVDISIEMLNTMKSTYTAVTACNTNMSNLDDFCSHSFDAVISIFTSFSFTEDIDNTIDEILRVLKPNGVVLISVIGKYSLRRLTKLKFSRKEDYTTRNNLSENFSYAWVFSKNELNEKFKINFVIQEIRGYNAFSGIEVLSKYSWLWRINRFISNLVPDLSHELVIIASKKGDNNV